jgi:tetraacyldisaccharide 4'-kinase
MSIRLTLVDIITGRRRGPVAATARWGLRAASLPYGVSVGIRNFLFDRGFRTIHRVAVPVISVGNLSVGGTGKTPCVELIGRTLVAAGYRPVILSRGYGSEFSRNDEAMVLEDNLPDVPHLQGADRVAIANTAIEELEADILILDDGFQHRRLHRDLNIVLLDATRPLDREWLLPGGLLREPAKCLTRADTIILTRTDHAQHVDKQIESIRRRVPNRPILLSQHQPIEWMNTSTRLPLEALAGRPVFAFSGLGNPHGFLDTLARLGIQPRETRAYADHHNYSRQDVQDLRAWAKWLPKDGVVLTTQKDFVKLRIDDLDGQALWALRIGLVITGGDTDLAVVLANMAPPIVMED